MSAAHPLRIYRERQQPRLTQDDLAEILGVNRTTVARWETGTRKIDADLIQDIAERTGIAPAKLRPDWAALLKRAPA